MSHVKIKRFCIKKLANDDILSQSFVPHFDGMDFHLSSETYFRKWCLNFFQFESVYILQSFWFISATQKFKYSLETSVILPP